MTTFNQNIFDKLEALLRLAKHEGTSIQEAEAAMLAAQRLAAKHHFDLSELQFSEVVEEDVIRVEANVMLRLQIWKANLACVIAKNFRCLCYIDQSRFRSINSSKKLRNAITIVGQKSDARMVAKLCDFAFEVGEDGARKFNKAHYEKYYHDGSQGILLRNTWLNGYVVGVNDKFKEQTKVDASCALMVITPQNVKDNFAQLNLRSTSSAVRTLGNDSRAYHDGYNTGRKLGSPMERLNT